MKRKPALCTLRTCWKKGDRTMTLRRKLLAAAFVAILAVPGVAKAEDNYHLTYHAAFGIAALNEASRVWMDEIEARTDGRVTFTRLFGGALGKFAGQPDGLRARSFDVGQLSAVYNPGLYPRATTTVITFLTDNAEAHNLASHEFFNTPEVQAEFDALNQKFMFVGQWARIEMLSYEHYNTMGGAQPSQDFALTVAQAMHSRPPASRATRSPGASFRQRRREGLSTPPSWALRQRHTTSDSATSSNTGTPICRSTTSP